MLCSRCNKNQAVIFITKLEGDKQTNEGLCLACAKAMGIAPINKLVEQMGINDEDIGALNDELNAMMEGIEGEDGMPMLPEDMEGDSPMKALAKMFGGFGMPKMQKDKKDAEEAPPEAKSTQTKDAPKQKKKKMLDTYGTNLSAKAAEGGVDRIIGRDTEIDRVVQILNRRTKNNPVLLGEPGVGKTAIAEGLALRIYEKQVPVKMYNKEVYLIDFTALVAGTQFRGQFESRLKALIEEAKKLGNIILVIDELHNIVGAGDADGAMSAGNILKPALARGEIQVLGATTLTEYRKHIEKDSALERRFQTVIVDEPSVEDSIEILCGIKDYYESYHKVSISKEIIEFAVRNAERYITERFLPDKAIDLIDEAGARANLNNTALAKLELLRTELTQVQSEKESAVSTDSIDDYQKAAELKAREFQLKEQIDALAAQSENIPITEEDIAAVIEAWTKIPMQRISEAEAQKLLQLETRLHERIIGQDKAVETISRAIRRGRAGLSKKKRPVSFIFVGPTGVGKTELVKALAEAMFDTEEAVIRLDMSEYSERHSVAKLIGAPPGYVGYDDAGQLTEKIRRKPYSIILLDEIEKADPEVFNILLQILDDGRITDSHGKTVCFENTIIVMTSNAGSNLKEGALGFFASEDTAIENKVTTALKNTFRPEFLNRVDDTVIFYPLQKEELLQIVDIQLAELLRELNTKNLNLQVSDEAKAWLCDKGYEPKYGARPLRRVIARYVEDALASLYIRGELKDGDTVTVSVEENELNVEKR